MVGRLILRGLLCGLIAGLLTFGFARVFGEPLVDKGIAFEEATAKAKGETPEPEIVSREVQAGPGLFTAALADSTALGGLFALVFALLYGRLGGVDARGTAALLALSAFVVLTVVPMIKYPSNPPGIGDPETIGSRTALYFEMIAVSLAAGALSAALARLSRASMGRFNANLAGIALFTLLAVAAMWLMPAVDEVPGGFSPVLLWRFRLTTVGMQAVTWATLGIAFGALARPVLEGQRISAPAARVAAAR